MFRKEFRVQSGGGNRRRGEGGERRFLNSGHYWRCNSILSKRKEKRKLQEVKGTCNKEKRNKEEKSLCVWKDIKKTSSIDDSTVILT